MDLGKELSKVEAAADSLCDALYSLRIHAETLSSVWSIGQAAKGSAGAACWKIVDEYALLKGFFEIREIRNAISDVNNGIIHFRGGKHASYSEAVVELAQEVKWKFEHLFPDTRTTLINGIETIRATLLPNDFQLTAERQKEIWDGHAQWLAKRVSIEELGELKLMVGKEVRAARRALSQFYPAATPPAPPEVTVPKYHGKRKYSVGDAAPMILSPTQDAVLSVLVIGGPATKDELIAKSRVDNAPRVLAEIRRLYPSLASFIVLPGKKASGGYRTTIAPVSQTPSGHYSDTKRPRPSDE